MGKLLNLDEHSIDNDTLEEVASDATLSCADMACIVNELKYLSKTGFFQYWLIFTEIKNI